MLNLAQNCLDELEDGAEVLEWDVFEISDCVEDVLCEIVFGHCHVGAIAFSHTNVPVYYFGIRWLCIVPFAEDEVVFRDYPIFVELGTQK